MNKELLMIWINAKEQHLNFCLEIGILYSEQSIKDQFHLLDQLKELAGEKKEELSLTDIF